MKKKDIKKIEKKEYVRQQNIILQTKIKYLGD
jgi:hypothetical protein